MAKCPRCQADNPPTSRYCAGCGLSLFSPLDQASDIRTQTFIASDDAFQTGTLFASRYQIIEELGRGGMGRVFKAHDIKIGEKVAVKIIRPEIAGDRKTIGRFRNELKLARQITHRNVCRMYDLGEERSTPFITMEYVVGKDLRSIIRMTGPLTVRTAVDYARQICEGLAEAHRLGVVHRDLKPQNIMIDESGTVKIMDFGIARSLDTAGATAEGILIGTPEYMSPEQAEGKQADYRTDIYALGVSLYEMITGTPPFTGETALSIVLKVKTELPRPPRELNPQVPGELDLLVLKCLQKDENKRFQSAQELSGALKDVENALPPTIIPRSPGETRTTRPIMRPKLQAGLGIALAALLISAGGYLLFRKKGPAGTPRPIFLAVLPLQDLSRDQNQGILCESFADDIRTNMSGIEGLKIPSKDVSDSIKNGKLDLRQIGRTLSVQRILRLDGTLQTTLNGLRINMSLSDALTGINIKTFPYPLIPEKTYFQVKDKFLDDLAQELNVRLTKERIQAIKNREPVVYEALSAFRKGIDSSRKYRGSNEENREEYFAAALDNFQNALALEPNYALAYWGLGNLYEARYNLEEYQTADLAVMRRFYQSAYKADPSLAEASLGLGWVYFHEKNFDRAYESFKKSVEIDKDNVSTNYETGSFLRSLGLYDKAEKYYLRTIELDPLQSFAYNNLATCYWYLGQYDRAEKYLREALAFQPDIQRVYLNLARQLLSQKKIGAAEKEIIAAEKFSPTADALFRHQVWLAAARGEKEKALALVKKVERAYMYEITNAYCLLGMTDEAIQNIRTGREKGFEQIREIMYVYPYLEKNPYFVVLRGDPRFKEILDREEKLYKEKSQKYGGL